MNKNLDFLRAVAVLLVTGGHLAAFFGWLGPYAGVRLVTLGTLGVLLFFVHTCLVLMQSLERDPGAASFLLRRIFRIYPLAIVVISLIIVSRIPQGSIDLHHFGGYTPDFRDIISNLSLTQNFSLGAPILGPTWSLSYEMQMYLFLPLFFALACTVSRAFALYFLSITVALTARHFSPALNLAYYAPCFLPGIVAYQIMKTKPRKLRAYGWPVVVILLCLVYTMGKDSQFKDYALCAMVGLAVPRFEQLRFPPLTQACHYVAKYSYGIYLSHFAIIYFAFERGGHLPLLLQFALFFALLAIIPAVLFHTIEDPMIQFGKKIVANGARKRGQSVAIPVPSNAGTAKEPLALRPTVD